MSEGRGRLAAAAMQSPGAVLQSRPVALLLPWAGLPVACLLAFLASFHYVTAPVEVRPLFDDSYISLTFARNLAEHGKLSFDGETWSTGATSPLHVTLMAIPIALGFSPLHVSVGFGMLSHVALTAGVYALAWAVFRSRLAAFLAALAIAFTSFAVLDSGNGLETSMFMALVAFAMASYFLFPSRRGRLLTGVLIALMVWTRPEGIFMIPAVLVYRWVYRPEGEQFRDYLSEAALLAGPGIFAMGTVALYALAVDGMIGGTAGAKRQFFGEDTWPLMDKMSALTYNVGLFMGPIVTLLALAALVLHRREALLFGLFWVPIMALYVELFPGGFGHYFYRYQHPVLPLVAVLAAGGAVYLIRLALERNFAVKALVVLGLIAVVVPMWKQFELHRNIYRQASFETYADLEAMVLDLNRIIRPDQVLAAHDIGAVQYFGDFRVLDTVGLVNKDVMPYHRQRNFPAYFETVHADYLLTFPDWDEWFFGLRPDERPDRFELVRVYEPGPIRGTPYILYRVLN